MIHPLHGRIANLPAHRLTVEADSEAGELRVTRVVDECRFLFQKLRLTSTLRLRLGQPRFDIADEVTNLSGNRGEMQLLYHINFGPPLLQAGGRVAAPIERLMPRDAHSAAGVGRWSRYGEPQAGAIEEVFYCRLLPDAEGRTEILLADAGANRGVSLHHRTAELPCFSLWKNAQPLADGYATGLEPATNFPNPRSFEAGQGRVRKFAAGETARFELALEIHDTPAAVQQAQQRIQSLQSTSDPEIYAIPQPGWTLAK